MSVTTLLIVTVVLTIGLVGVLMGGMALGLIFSGRRLQGSCGGTGADCLCEKRERGECPSSTESADRLIPARLNRNR